jgi:hypothetical protein
LRGRDLIDSFVIAKRKDSIANPSTKARPRHKKHLKRPISFTTSYHPVTLSKERHQS